MFKKLRLALPTICLLLGAVAHAGDSKASVLASSLTYCTDRPTSTEPTQVLDCEFQPQNTVPSRASPAGARWVRLAVELKQAQPSGLRLYVGPHYLPHITLFEQVQGQWVSQTAGGALPLDPSHSVIAGYRFVTAPQPGGKAVFYFRVQAPGMMPLRILVEPLDAPERGLQSQILGLGLQVGGLLLMTVLAVGVTLLRRDRLMQCFAVYAANLLLCVLSGSGILSLYILGDYPRLDDWLFHGLWCLRLPIWIWLMNAFFEGQSIPRWYQKICQGLQVMALPCLALVALGWLMAVQVLVLVGTALFSVAQIIVLRGLQGMPVFYRKVLFANFLATDALIAGVVLASVYSGGTDLATYMARAVDFATPLILLLVIAYKRRLDHEEFVRVKVDLQKEGQRVRFHQQALQDRKLLVDMLAHELRNPLSSIGFAVSSLQEETQDSDRDQTQRFRNINRSIKSMDSIIERCSLVNLVDQESTVVKREPLSLSELVDDLVHHSAECERIDLDLCPQGALLNSDRQLLKIVIGNILENALKYSPLDSRVQVKVRTERHQDDTTSCIVSVVNAVSVYGSPEAENVFQKYYRHPLARAQSGSGLGLYLVREICRWIGGDVTYTKTQDVLFEVRLPA